MAKDHGGVDPDVKVPRAIREQSERAAAAQLASIGQAEPPVLPPVTPEVTPPAQAELPLQQGAPVAPPAEPQHDPNAPIDWEKKYKTLNGRIEAENKKVRTLSERMQQLERQLAATAAPPPARTQKPLPLSADEIADYGDDLIGVIQRVAAHTVEGRVAPLADELGRTQAQVGVQQVQTMHQQMDALYPEWARMNAHPAFIEWTMLPDAYSGAIRQTLMQQAWDAGDARRVNAFFQGFLAEEAALTPAGAVPPIAASAPAAPFMGAPAAAPPLALASLAAPGGARSASHMPAEKPVYTTEDITRFYTEVAAGKWRGRDADRIAIDADISRAQHEGRIITNQRRYTPPSAPNGFIR